MDEESLFSKLLNLRNTNMVNSDILSTTMRGGGSEVEDNIVTKYDATDTIISMFQKHSYFYLIFITSILISVYITSLPIIQNVIFKDEDDIDKKQNGNYMKITCLFTGILCIVFITLYVIISAILLCVYEMSSHIKTISNNSRLTFIYNTLFTFYNGTENVFAFDFYLSVFIIVFIGLCFYLLYFLFNKSYFQNIEYPSYIDKEYDSKEEWTIEQKYIITYGFILIIFLLCALMIINNVYTLPSNISLFVYIFIILLLYMLCTSNITLHVLSKSYKKLICWTVVLVFIILINKYVAKGYVYGISKMISQIHIMKSKKM